jgi:ABC-type phosphate transport system auxiliary subunit
VQRRARPVFTARMARRRIRRASTVGRIANFRHNTATAMAAISSNAKNRIRRVRTIMVAVGRMQAHTVHSITKYISDICVPPRNLRISEPSAIRIQAKKDEARARQLAKFT